MIRVETIIRANSDLYGDGKYYITQLDALTNIPRAIGDYIDCTEDQFRANLAVLVQSYYKKGWRTVRQVANDPEVMMAAVQHTDYKGDELMCFLQNVVGFATNLSNKEIIHAVEAAVVSTEFDDSGFAKNGIYNGQAVDTLKRVYAKYFPVMRNIPTVDASVCLTADNFYENPDDYPAIKEAISQFGSTSTIYQIVVGMFAAVPTGKSAKEVYGRV